MYMLVSECCMCLDAVVCAAMHICDVRSFCCCVLLPVACVLFLCGVRYCDYCVCMSSFAYVVFKGLQAVLFSHISPSTLNV